MYWRYFESTEAAVQRQLYLLGRHPAVIRLDGEETAEHGWMLYWRPIAGTKRHLIIRTASFARYCAAVAQAIEARRPLTIRKPPAIAPAASNEQIRGKLTL